MRRRKIDEPAHGRPVFHGGVKVEVVLLEHVARLVTVRPTDAMTHVAGAIVKLVPDADSTAEMRAAVVAAIRHAGALHVWVAPRPPGARAVARERKAAPAAESPRHLVERMVDEAHTKDRERLRHVVDEALTKEGV